MPHKLTAALGFAAAAMLVLTGCPMRRASGPPPGQNLQTVRQEQELNERKPDERRLLFAQIVEDTEPNAYAESAIIEGKAFKYFLKQCGQTTHDALRKQTNDQITFETLESQPGMYRGQIVTLQRGVVLEVSEAKLGPEYGLPPGSTVLVAVFVDSARDVYALRILCAPNSRLYQKLQRGIEDDALPVARMSGYFMKLYARQTNDPKEPPWRRPLLICPEPEFSRAIEPRHVADDMRVSGTDKLLPSQRITAPGAEERLVVEIYPSRIKPEEPVIRCGGKLCGPDLNAFIAEHADALVKRLPNDQKQSPAAVILISPRTPQNAHTCVLAALRAAGIKRIAVKKEQ